MKDNHRRLSPRAVELLERYEEDPGLAAPYRLAEQGLPDWVVQYPYVQQPWPTFVSGDKLEELRTAVVELTRLVKSVPERIFGSDPAKVAEYYGFNPAVVMFMLGEPTGIEPAMCRGDFVDTERGLRCLEMNLDSLLGGWQLRFLRESMLRPPAIAELAGTDPPARYVDPVIELFDHVASRVLADPKLGDGGEVDLAFLVPEEAPVAYLQGAFGYLAEEYERFRRRHDPPFEGRLVMARTGDLSLEGGEIHLDGRRLHALVDYQKPALDRNLFRSFKAGRVHHYNGPMSLILRDKRNLALLSEHAEDRELFDDRERALLRAHVPWTREVRERVTDFEHRSVDLVVLAMDHQEEMVLKPIQGMGGESIHFGLAHSREIWEDMVRQAIRDGGWLIQELEHAVPYWYPHEGEVVPHDVVWGVFAFGSRYAGGFLRMMPAAAEGNVINAAQGASEGLILEIE